MYENRTAVEDFVNSSRMRAARIATLVLILAGLIPVFRVLRWTWGLYEYARGEDELTALSRRYDEVKAALPPDAVIGYVAYRRPEVVLEDPRTRFEFVAARYALAPIMVLNGPRPGIVLGNFPNPRALARHEADPAFELIQNFGGGVALFRVGEE